jgi:hypothetical protein
LSWISQGAGFDITGADVLAAYTAVMQAASGAGVDALHIKAQIREMTSGSHPGNQFMNSILAHHLST